MAHVAHHYPHAIPDSEKQHAKDLGISFNGTQFAYREFKYDKLPDAITYAELDALRKGQQKGVSYAPEWLDQTAPCASDRELMRQYGITSEGWRYRYREFRYDRLADAINYAANQN